MLQIYEGDMLKYGWDQNKSLHVAGNVTLLCLHSPTPAACGCGRCLESGDILDPRAPFQIYIPQAAAVKRFQPQ